MPNFFFVVNKKGLRGHDERLAKRLACQFQHSIPASTDQVDSVKLALSEKNDKAGFSEEEAKALFDEVSLN